MKDTNEKVLLSGLEQTLLINSPCVIQGKGIIHAMFFFREIYFIDQCLVHTESAPTAQIRAVVLLGTRPIPSTTSIVNDNLVRIHFIPQEPGVYLVHASSVNQPIEGI